MARTALELSRELTEGRIEGVFRHNITGIFYTQGTRIKHPVENGYWFRNSFTERMEYVKPEHLGFLELIE
jgi:hypothetical protein